jgi:hypothetical protein
MKSADEHQRVRHILNTEVVLTNPNATKSLNSIVLQLLLIVASELLKI